MLTKRQKMEGVDIYVVINMGCLWILIFWVTYCICLEVTLCSKPCTSLSGQIICWCNVYLPQKLLQLHSLMIATRSQTHSVDGKKSQTQFMGSVGYRTKCLCPCGAVGRICKRIQALKLWWLSRKETCQNWDSLRGLNMLRICFCYPNIHNCTKQPQEVHMKEVVFVAYD